MQTVTEACLCEHHKAEDSKSTLTNRLEDNIDFLTDIPNTCASSCHASVVAHLQLGLLGVCKIISDKLKILYAE